MARKRKKEGDLFKSLKNTSAENLRKAKMSKSSGSSKSESVFDKTTKYDVGKIIYIR